MRLSVLCVALFMGVTVLARPQGEASPADKPAGTQPAVQAEGQEEAARPKRWYLPYGYGHPYPSRFFNTYGSNSFYNPAAVSGRTGSSSGRYAATFDELLEYQRRSDYALWQQQQWMQNQGRFTPNQQHWLHNQGEFGPIPQQWMQHQSEFGPQQQWVGNQGDNLPDVIDTSARTRIPHNMNAAGTGPRPFFTNPQWNRHPYYHDYNNQRPSHGYFP